MAGIEFMISPLVEQGIERYFEFLEPEFKDTTLSRLALPDS